MVEEPVSPPTPQPNTEPVKPVIKPEPTKIPQNIVDANAAAQRMEEATAAYKIENDVK